MGNVTYEITNATPLPVSREALKGYRDATQAGKVYPIAEIENWYRMRRVKDEYTKGYYCGLLSLTGSGKRG